MPAVWRMGGTWPVEVPTFRVEVSVKVAVMVAVMVAANPPQPGFALAKRAPNPHNCIFPLSLARQSHASIS